MEGKTEVTIEEIHQAYEIVRESIAVDSFRMLVGVFLGVTLVSRIISTYKEVDSNDDGAPAMKDFKNMIYQYALLLVVVVLMPFLLGILETGFEKIMAAMQDKMGGAKYDVTDLFLKPLEAELTHMIDSNFLSAIVHPVGKLIDYTLSFIVGGIGAAFYKYTIVIFIAGRYMFLLLLELISPVAIACFYNEGTRSYFYQWCKSLLACYLMVPAFLLASQFSDCIVCLFVMGTVWPITTQILFSLALKLTLLGIVKNKITNLF